MDEFLEKYKHGQYRFEEDRCEFRNLDFKDWRTNGQGSFWRFFMEVLANVYGLESWTEIKNGKYDCLIDDFVWGNCLSVQCKESDHTNPSAKGYDFALESAQKYLNSIDYLEEVFAPDAVILTYKYYGCVKKMLIIKLRCFGVEKCWFFSVTILIIYGEHVVVEEQKSTLVF